MSQYQYLYIFCFFFSFFLFTVNVALPNIGEVQGKLGIKTTSEDVSRDTQSRNTSE